MDGELGLKKIAELRPHVVTLDLDMPRMDGIEMLRQITRKHRVPVIVVSSQTRTRRHSHPESAGSRRIRFRRQAAGRRFGPHRSDRRRTGAQNQSGCSIRRSENDHHGSFRETEGTAAVRRCAALAVAHRGYWRFHRRSERAAISFFAASRGFSGLPSRRAAHARRLHRNVCAAPQRILRHRSQGSAVGRSACSLAAR